MKENKGKKVKQVAAILINVVIGGLFKNDHKIKDY